MIIEKVNRPWLSRIRQGARYNPDPFYHTTLWKATRRAFIQGHTDWQGQKVSNSLCIECFKEGITTVMHTVDHITPIKQGGERTAFSNLQSLCQHHHAVKSANEGKE